MQDAIRTVRQHLFKTVVTRILRSAAAQRIDFSIGYLHITGAGLRRVADDVDRGSIAIEIGGVPPGAGAAYSPDGKFYFPDRSYGFQASEEMDIVHEATHALVAVYRRGRIWPPDTLDEAAAYLSEALYNVYRGSPVTDVSLVLPQQIQASLIANSIQAHAGALVPARDEGLLRAFVASRPVYSQSGITYSSSVYSPRR
jgi:hypothetical protein